ncbi:retrovirus-related pol polyprotein from transposon TNT 1-94 [Tanacetum coccineum]
MATMAENVIDAENGEMLRDSVEHGPYKFKSETTVKDTDGVTDIRHTERPGDLKGDDKLRYDSDIKDRVKELMEGTKMIKQERECMLYDEFDKFTSEPKESIHSYYLRFAKLINDMNMIPMSMTPMQINTKFVNHLQPEWSRFVIAAKQARNLHSVTFDQLYAFLKHNERDAKKVQEMRQRLPEPPLALLANTNNPPPSYSSNQTQTQATIKNGQVTVQNVQGRQSQGYARNAGNNQASGAQCTTKKRVKDSEWFKDKMLLSQAQEAGVVLDEEQHDFLADSLEETNDCEDIQLQATTNFKAYHIDAYDSDCDAKLQHMQSSWQVCLLLVLSMMTRLHLVMILKHSLRVKVLGYAVKDGHSEQEAYLSRELYTVINDRNRKVKDFEKQVFSQQTQMKDLNNHIAFLKKIFETLKQESSERYEKNISEIVDLENVKKKLENIVFKVGQSTQTMHKLTKPQNFYDETHKTALGYQNPLYLSQDRWKQPALYNGNVLIKEHNPVTVCDSEETLILVEENLLTKFDECIERRTTLSPHEIGSWEQSDIKSAFKADVIPFFENLKETFRLFEKGFITEVKEMKDNFKQMEEEVNQCYVAKKSFEIEKKQLLINNDRLLEENIASDIMCTYLCSLNEVDICGKCKSLDIVIPKVVEKNDFKKSITLHLTTKKIIENCTKVLAPVAKEHIATLQELLEEARALKPLDEHIGRVSSINASGSKPISNTKNDRILQPSSRSMKNKVEAYHRKFKSSANKNNHVSYCNTNVKNVALSKNSYTICISCNACLFSANHDANDHFAAIMGYGDLQIGNILISRVYYVEGLGHNLFSVGQFCDSNLEVAFRKHTCFVRNLEGVELLSGSRGSNLYTISMVDMMKSSPICLLSKASNTKSWLWHRRLSHLNFGTINQLAKQGLVKGLPKLKYTKDHLCSACQMGKSKKESHPHKPEPSTNEKL